MNTTDVQNETQPSFLSLLKRKYKCITIIFTFASIGFLGTVAIYLISKTNHNEISAKYNYLMSSLCQNIVYNSGYSNLTLAQMTSEGYYILKGPSEIAVIDNKGKMIIHRYSNPMISYGYANSSLYFISYGRNCANKIQANLGIPTCKNKSYFHLTQISTKTLLEKSIDLEDHYGYRILAAKNDTDRLLVIGRLSNGNAIVHLNGDEVEYHELKEEDVYHVLVKNETSYYLIAYTSKHGPDIYEYNSVTGKFKDVTLKRFYATADEAIAYSSKVIIIIAEWLNLYLFDLEVNKTYHAKIYYGYSIDKVKCATPDDEGFACIYKAGEETNDVGSTHKVDKFMFVKYTLELNILWFINFEYRGLISFYKTSWGSYNLLFFDGGEIYMHFLISSQGIFMNSQNFPNGSRLPIDYSISGNSEISTLLYRRIDDKSIFYQYARFSSLNALSDFDNYCIKS